MCTQARVSHASSTALGTVSYSVYLVHFGVITLAVAALVHVGVEVDDMTAIACGGLGMAAGVAFHHLVDSPIQAWLRQAMKRPESVTRSGHCAWAWGLRIQALTRGTMGSVGDVK